MAEVTLYSMVICPFAQRTRIHLALKGVPFTLENLDICAPRPEWFLALNPKGQVPTLVVDGQAIADSSAVSEFIEERFVPAVPFGRDAEAREAIRDMIRYVDANFVPRLYHLMAADDAASRQAREAAALETWRWLDDFLVGLGYQSGFLDGAFGMAEISVAPFFHRYQVVAYYQGFELPDSGSYARVQAWREAILAHPLVTATAEPIEDLIKMYEDYTLGFYNGAVPPGRDRSSLDLSVPMAERSLPAKLA